MVSKLSRINLLFYFLPHHPSWHRLKDSAVVVVVDFDGGIESGDNLEFFSAVITLDSVTLSLSKGAVQSSSDNQRSPTRLGGLWDHTNHRLVGKSQQNTQPDPNTRRYPLIANSLQVLIGEK